MMTSVPDKSTSDCTEPAIASCNLTSGASRRRAAAGSVHVSTLDIIGRDRYSVAVTKPAIIRRLTDAERELRRMEVHLRRYVSRGEKRPFSQLRGLWEDAQAIGEEDVKKARIRFSPDE